MDSLEVVFHLVSLPGEMLFALYFKITLKKNCTGVEKQECI